MNTPLALREDHLLEDEASWSWLYAELVAETAQRCGKSERDLATLIVRHVAPRIVERQRRRVEADQQELEELRALLDGTKEEPDLDFSGQTSLSVALQHLLDAVQESGGVSPITEALSMLFDADKQWFAREASGRRIAADLLEALKTG